MRGIDELDYYELLEIPRTASLPEVERAYRQAQQVYGEGSLALYSVFESHDVAAIRERLDEAYRILSDGELRSSYDESQSFSGDVSVEASSATESGIQDFERQTTLDLSGGAPSNAIFAADVEDGDREYDVFEDEGDGDFDGMRLRRTRLFRGYEIDDISDVTKVSGAHLRNIEEENFLDLPADVYVRGFVTAYASTEPRT